MEKQSFKKYYALYTVTNFTYGLCYTEIGPLIPYLAENAKREETNYSYLFLYRAIGMIIGTLFLSFIQKRNIINFHHLLALSSLGVFIVLSFFSYTTNLLFQYIALLFNGFFNGII